jgi:hypothetical protein
VEGAALRRQCGGGEHRLVPQLGHEDGAGHGQHDRPAVDRPGTLAVGTGLFPGPGVPVAQRPGCEPEEQQAAHQSDGPDRQGHPQQPTGQHGQQVADAVADRHPDEHRAEAVPCPEPQGDELRLVTQLGDEHQPQGGKQRLHDASPRSG